MNPSKARVNEVEKMPSIAARMKSKRQWPPWNQWTLVAEQWHCYEIVAINFRS